MKIVIFAVPILPVLVHEFLMIYWGDDSANQDLSYTFLKTL